MYAFPYNAIHQLFSPGFPFVLEGFWVDGGEHTNFDIGVFIEKFD
jgi:hypothetical protein